MINDSIHGAFDVHEAVLLELMESYPVQRLKGIMQHGIPEGTDTEFPHYTRYEHSVGVMLLLRKLNASLEEQIAGLLHDVSHTAFSHVVDWIFGDPTKEDYQDNMLSDHIRGSVINGILSGHGFDAEKISRMELNGEYKLLERNLPSLCADRVDYALRDSYHIFGVDVRGCADSLAVMDNEIVFKSKEYARQFGEWFFECQNAWWRADENKLRYLLMADALSLAIKKGILTHEQLYGTDREVLDMLKNSKDKEVLRKLTIALGKLEFRVESDGAIELVTKMRYVDPKFIDGGKAVQLSDADGTYKNLIETELKKHSSNVRVNLIEKIYKPALVYIRDNKLLSVRSKGKDVFYIPGGKREFGETDEQALTREIKEELNVDVVQSSIKHMDTFEDHAHGRSKDTTVHISFYSADIIGEPSAGSEIEEVAWLDYSQRNKYPEEWLFLFDWLRDRGLLK